MADRALDESRRYQAELRPRVAAANKNLGRRIRVEGMEVEYEPERDHLYVTLGSPRPSEAIALGDGTHTVILLDPETYEITGLEAPFFMEDFNRVQQQNEFWQLIVELIQKRGNVVYIPPDEQTKRTEKALSTLVSSPPKG